MKIDNSCNIENIGFLLYMQEQEEKKEKNKQDQEEKHNTNK